MIFTEAGNCIGLTRCALIGFAQLTQDTPTLCISGLTGQGADVTISTTHFDQVHRAAAQSWRLFLDLQLVPIFHLIPIDINSEARFCGAVDVPIFVDPNDIRGSHIPAPHGAVMDGQLE